MNLLQKLFQALEDGVLVLVSSVAASVVTGVWWLIRQVFTQKELIKITQQQLNLTKEEMKALRIQNSEQLEVLRKEITQREDYRDKLRSEDREDIKEAKASIKNVENFLLRRGHGKDY